MKTVVYSGGHWSPNIGNAFFNLGIVHALKQACPDYGVHFLSDPPGWFWQGLRKPGPADLLIDDVHCDYLVISGPLFCRELVTIWGHTLEKLAARGTKIVFLSAGAIRYDEQELADLKPLLERIKPYLLVTRDSATFERYAGFCERAYDGICFAFYSNDVIDPSLEFDGRDINLCFDKNHDYDVLDVYEAELKTLLADQVWPDALEPRALKRRRSASNRTEFAGHRVVRPHHAPNPFFTRRIKSALFGYAPFSRPNTLAGDLPYSYLHQYRRAPLTISERVHACVPALAFGNHAWLISDTPRSRLFDRAGIPDAVKGPAKADLGQLAEEKQSMIKFLNEALHDG